MTADTERKVQSWEALIRTIGQTLSVLALAWIGTTLIGLREDVAVIKAQAPLFIEMNKNVMQLSERVSLLESEVYERRADAEKIR